MKKILAVAILSISLATPAFAEESPLYAGALLGNQYIGVLGGYQIDKMYSVEISYAKVLTPTVNFGGGSTSTSDQLGRRPGGHAALEGSKSARAFLLRQGWRRTPFRQDQHDRPAGYDHQRDQAEVGWRRTI